MRAILLAAAFSLASIFFLPTAYSEPTCYDVISLSPGSQPYRILLGSSPYSYWIVNFGIGLIHAEELNGQWNIEYFAIQGAYDATGPDSSGLIYVTVRVDPPNLVIFDTSSGVVIDSIEFPAYMAGLQLSQDETHLYVCGWSWPSVGSFYSPGDTKEHTDSGRIYEFDLESKSITRTAVVGSLPETIYETPFNTLLVSVNDSQIITKPLAGSEWMGIVGEEEYVDIVDLDQFERILRLTCNYTIESGAALSNQFFSWSDDGRYAAMCLPEVTYLDIRPGFEDGIWIIDTMNNTVSDKFILVSPDSCTVGAQALCRSSVDPSLSYVCTSLICPPYNYKLLAIDHTSGQLVEGFEIPGNLILEDVTEMPNGNLLVTGGKSGKILIIDPT